MRPHVPRKSRRKALAIYDAMVAGLSIPIIARIVHLPQRRAKKLLRAVRWDIVHMQDWRR